MVRENRQMPTSYSAYSRRSKSAGWLPVVVGGGLFALLLAVVAFVAHETQATPKSSLSNADDNVANTGVAPSASQSPVGKSLPVERSQTTRSRDVNRKDLRNAKPLASTEPSATPQPQNQRQSPQLDSANGRLDAVQASLAAGEFGSAADITAAVKNRAEKTQLLKIVADAQMNAGEFNAALASIRRIPDAKERTRARSNRSSRMASAAGGSGADFTQLIALIQEETSGPWFDDEGSGGTISEFETGVRVDPNGLLYHISRADFTGRLNRLGIRARKADLNQDMAKASSLRLVSLTRLERVIRKRLAAGQPVVETMKNFAGLQKIEYVFVDPKSREIFIGGPAEGWHYDARGLPVGVKSGRPTLQLDDFVTVLRTFSRDGQGMFNCLIVPRQAGLEAARRIGKTSRQRGSLSGSGATRNFVKRLTKALGEQNVRVNGVPVESRVARVMVEADYRMKMIGIHRLDGGSRIPSYFDLLAKHPPTKPLPTDALRWWLTMKYDAVLHSKDRNVFQIQGSSVLCQGLNERITPTGQRIHTGKADPMNLLFAQNFTNNYAELARRDIVFADLQNIFDLSLVAALIRFEGLDQRVQWHGSAFATDGNYRPAVYKPARTVMSLSNHRVYKGGKVVVQVAGGVRADLMSVVRNTKISRESPRLGSLLDFARAPSLPDGRWWWDARK